MKAIQIVMKGDERSEEYAALSRWSFQRAIDDGYIDSIETFDAITPQSDTFQEHVDKYTWSKSLMTLDLNSGNGKEDHSPTEKAGMCSHWELMRQQGESNEKFWIMEHDTWLVEERYEAFKLLTEYAENTLYANIGLFMGMYCMDRSFAHWSHHMMTGGNNFPINCGPYCTLQRLFRTYTTNWLSRPEIDYYGIRNTALHPWFDCDTIGVGRDIGVYFNNRDRRKNGIPTPTTQVISKKLLVTQDHHGYKEEQIQIPWTRHKFFHVID
jgi:hypothetical protein